MARDLIIVRAVNAYGCIEHRYTDAGGELPGPEAERNLIVRARVLLYEESESTECDARMAVLPYSAEDGDVPRWDGLSPDAGARPPIR